MASIKEAEKLFLESYKLELQIDTGQISRKEYYTPKTKKRKCRFCKLSVPNVKFKTYAHLIPKFLGSKYLLSSYECDNCNKLFKKYENDFANFIGGIRSINGITGKSNNPTYKSKTIKIFQGDEGKINFISDDIAQKIADGETQIKVPFIKNPLVELNVYKALLKIGLSIVPENEIENVPKAFKFLMTNDKEIYESLKGKLNIFRVFLPGPRIPTHPIIQLFKRIDESKPVPELIVIVRIKNFVFQFYIPKNVNDNYLVKTGCQVPLLPINYPKELIDKFGSFQYEVIELSSTKLQTQKTDEVGINISNVKKINR